MPSPIAGLHQVTERVRCLLAPNPSPMTGCGTNSYLVATEAGTVVIDPGPALPAHLERLLSATAAATPEAPAGVAAILVTHPHLDHSALAPALAAETGAPVLAFGTCHDGRSAVMAQLAAAGLQGGGEGIDRSFRPDRRLIDGERLVFGAQSLEVLHCPGHMGAHLCFAFGCVLFSGDHAMGWATSMISPPDGDMSDYMASLRRLAGRRWRCLLPGHGGAVVRPAARLAALIAHRSAREWAIRNALAAGHETAQSITSVVYPGLAPALIPAAERNVLAHLYDLVARNLAHPAAAPAPQPRFRQGGIPNDIF